MEGKAVFGGGQGKGGEADNKLNIDSIIARLLEGDPFLEMKLYKFNSIQFHDPYILSLSLLKKTEPLQDFASV